MTILVRPGEAPATPMSEDVIEKLKVRDLLQCYFYSVVIWYCPDGWAGGKKFVQPVSREP